MGCSVEQTYVKTTSEFQDTFGTMYNVDTPENLQKYSEKDLATKNLTFVMTEECNLRCTYCYQVGKNRKFMSKEVARKAVDLLFDTERNKNFVNDKIHQAVILDFIGGEPFMNVDVMDFIVDYFRFKATMENSPWALNYMISVSTNGTLNHTRRVKRFIEKNQGRISVSITIDGNKDLHDSCRVFANGKGSYDIVERNVKNAIAEHGLSSTKVTFAPENIDKITTAIPHLFEMGLREINANAVFENVWKPKDAYVFYDQLIKLADWYLESGYYKSAVISIFEESIGKPMKPEENDNWCGGDGKMLTIGCDGKLYPCLRFMSYSMENKERREIIIGNVDDGMIDIKDDPLVEELFGITRRSQSTDKCFNCQVTSGCGWCTAHNYDVFGSSNIRATFTCMMHKVRVLANYYYWNKLYKKLGKDDFFECNLTPDEVQFITQGKGIPAID